MKSLIQFAAVLLAFLVVLIASIVCKENATNGFEVFIGWLGMAESVAAIVAVALYYRNNYDVNGNKKS